MSRFINEDDEWGIRKAVRRIWEANTVIKDGERRIIGSEEISFNAFFNQFVPTVYLESKETVIRHIKEINALLEDNSYHTNCIWIKRNNQLKCGVLTQDLANQIKVGTIELPTYMEIQEEKMKWQSHPRYRKELGTSVPIKEEMISLRIIKK